MKVAIEGLRTEMQLRDENQTRAIQYLSEKLDFAIDIRERLSKHSFRATNFPSLKLTT